jgi:hypothetical protein
VVGARLASGVAALAPAAPRAAAVNWATYGAAWQRQYEQQHPTTIAPALIQYGADWQRQYEQQHPTTMAPAPVQ